MQLVGYDPSPSPALHLASDGVIERIPLDTGRALSFALTERHCAGKIRDRRHLPCDDSAAPWCERHVDRWPCARCRGDCNKPIPACDREHEVYLAAFAPAVFKVGVTRAGRLAERLAEQGADRGTKIRHASDGRIARSIETQIAESIPDRVDIETKIDGLQRPLDTTAWNALIDEYGGTDVIRPEYEFALDAPPIPETLARGEVVGVKGRLLFLQVSGSHYATDLQALVGYDVTKEPSRRDIQIGLGTFS